MRKFFAILLLSALASCQYLNRQVPDSDELLQKELKSINWNDVDEYPSVATCDSVSGKDAKKQCFFQYLTELIQQKLNIDTTSVTYPKHDTINVMVTVLPDATLQFAMQSGDSLSYNRTQIDSILRTRLTDFPEVKPALKRGIPVKTQFLLPVILNVQRKGHH